MILNSEQYKKLIRKLGRYPTSRDLKVEFAKHATKDDLILELTKYTTKEKLKRVLSGYVTKKKILRELSKYASIRQLDITMLNFKLEIDEKFASKQEMHARFDQVVCILDSMNQRMGRFDAEMAANIDSHRRFDQRIIKLEATA